LSHDSFEDFVTNGREDALVVVLAEVLLDVSIFVTAISPCSTTYLVDGGQLGHLRPVQDSESQAHHLQVLAAGGCGDVPRLGAHIVDDRLLKPGNEEVGALVDDALADTTQTVEDDGAVAAFDIVQRGLGETDAGGQRNGETVDGVEGVGGHVEVCIVCLCCCWRALFSLRPRQASSTFSHLHLRDAGSSRLRLGDLQ